MIIIRKSHIIIKTIANFLVDLPAASNLSFIWNFGSLLGLCIFIQIITGFLLTIHYSSNIDTAFSCIAHTLRDVNIGWCLRSMHANGASILFLCIYIHIARGIYFKSFLLNEVWLFGVLIYILAISTAFTGYLLPWGQIRFWGATVITNIFSAIPYFGNITVIWLWGGFAVRNPTLTRFFALHFILPFVILFIIILHLVFLHLTGSRNPLGINSNFLKTPFHLHFTTKDTIGFMLLLIFLCFLVFFNPNLLGDPENFIPANPLVTPTHIIPEWYFLWAYAILRSIPNKLGGVIIIAAAIIILFFLPVLWKKNNFSILFFQVRLWFLIVIFILLTWIGRCPVEPPYDWIGLIFTIFYILLFFIDL